MRTPEARGVERTSRTMRALRRALGPQTTYRFSPSTKPDNIDRMYASPLVTRFLQRQLGLPGRVRGGLLFGHHFEDTLHVLTASTAGLPWWYGKDEERAALSIDERFTLAWSEAVGEVWQGYADWCGNWLIQPDEQLGGVERDARWFRRGVRKGVFDDRHPLLVVGYEDGQLQARAYLLGTLEEPVVLPCGFEAGGVEETLRFLADLLGSA